MDTLIEAYIITIAYEEGVPALQISKKSRSSGSKNAEETTTLFVAKDGIHKLVDNILTDAGQLNSLTGNLPEDCLINLHLVYTQDSPANYNAPGFYEGDTTLLVKPEEVSTSAFKTQTGFHAYVSACVLLLPCFLTIPALLQEFSTERDRIDILQIARPTVLLQLMQLCFLSFQLLSHHLRLVFSFYRS